MTLLEWQVDICNSFASTLSAGTHLPSDDPLSGMTQDRNYKTCSCHSYSRMPTSSRYRKMPAGHLEIVVH